MIKYHDKAEEEKFLFPCFILVYIHFLKFIANCITNAGIGGVLWNTLLVRSSRKTIHFVLIAENYNLVLQIHIRYS